MANTRVVGVEGEVVKLDGNRELSCQLFLGVPRNRAPDVVVATGLTEDGWVTIDKRTLETKAPNVWAIGDLANTGAPKAGIFAEAAAVTVGKNLLSKLRNEAETAKNPARLFAKK
jgi:sulfide:quinone oxidoreductase